MLKAIEIAGFKSFADRTRMEFSDGISALVGPNGSGKSNIVDAIKWVLGEQSVKKLRGSEMTDVIFNGSAGRQALGAAEVTLSFDNREKTFALDTPEVHITRRIYRSGEGEYLINRQAARLKDIKDLLTGTGLGTQAYSIIEQGRVESLLQNSSVQRRTIFEEAAGISRFHAKKQEVQRRLERVEQNMIRLGDIVAEVENQLKTSKAQAGKAQQYRQYTERLKVLRTEAGAVEWKARTVRCATLRDEIETIAASESGYRTAVEKSESELAAHAREFEELAVAIRRFEGDIAAVRERILGAESTVELQIAQIGELETELGRHTRQLLDLNTKSVDTEEMKRRGLEEIGQAKTAFEETSRLYRQRVEEADRITLEAAAQKREKEETARRAEQANRRLERLAGEIKGYVSRLETLENTRTKTVHQLSQLESKRRELGDHLGQLRSIAEDLTYKTAEKERHLLAMKQRKESRQAELETTLAELSVRKQRQSGLRERIGLIEELLRKHEGLSPGVREVLRLARVPESPFRHVHGLVADILRVDVEAASLIELALGPKAQQIVVSPEPELFRHIERSARQFAGRVGFIWLDPNPGEGSWNKPVGGFFGRPGVHGRADLFVKTDPLFEHLAHRLLGRTWIVENLAAAKQLYRESDDRTNFLTVGGELLEADGTLVVGPAHGSSGLITRRSELRTLAEQLSGLDASIDHLELDLAVFRQRLLEDEQAVDEATREHQRLLNELQAQRHQIALAEDRLAQNRSQSEHLGEEEKTLAATHAGVRAELERHHRENAELETAIRREESLLADQTNRYEELERRRREHSRNVTASKIELVKCEERLDFLKDRIRQFEEHQRERQHLAGDHRNRLAALKHKREQAELAVLRDEAALSMTYVRKEELLRSGAGRHRRYRELTAMQRTLQETLKQDRETLASSRAALQSKRLELEHLYQEQKSLLDRMREDYGIDSTELEQVAENPALQGDAAEKPVEESVNIEAKSRACKKEIEELRTKIARLGHVNLEAIETLEGLETRFTTLSNQLSDLRTAKKTIEKIVEKLNLDSQRLFEETFVGVRAHFQDLFRNLFGGGHADLVLEDESNPLESGVDIVARPPGKELKSVTLLSGGEKTLTCVALLLAFFRFRPNPVCILDECDAALDEGNIDRFVRVLRDFRTATQFLIVTHSKKTMACATTMYGITMQESGISKPISVQFVDVGENGELLDPDGRPALNGNSFSIDTPEAA